MISSQVLGQSEWMTFQRPSRSYQLETYENKVYITNAGGLLIVDLDTGEEEFLTTTNSGLQGSGLHQINILDDGTFWLTGFSNCLLYTSPSPRDS